MIGQHRGYPFYTVGQRKGLEIAFGDPKYVTKIEPDTNTVVLGEESDLLETKMWIRDPNLMKYETLPEQMDVVTKIRYKHPGEKSTITPLDDGRIEVKFKKPVSAVAPGQSAVFYEGDDVLGGGFIDRATK